MHPAGATPATPWQVQPEQAISNAKVKQAAQAFREQVKPTISLPGVGNIVNRRLRLTRRLAWTVVLVSATALMVYQVSLCLTRFLEKPVSSVLRVVRNDTLLMPAITVCDKTRYIRSRYKAMTNGTMDVGTLQWDRLGPDTLPDFLLNVTSPRENVITRCLLQGDECDNVGSWKDSYPFSLGRCFTFYPDESHAVTARISSGYRLWLRTSDRPDYYSPTTGFHRGWLVFVHGVHDPLTLKSWIAVNTPIDISVADTREVAIGAQQVRSLRRVDSPCQPQPQYSAVRCMELCLAEWVLNTGSRCRTPDMVTEEIMCSNYSSYQQNQVLYDRDTEFDTAHVDACYQQCPQRCDLVQFTTYQVGSRKSPLSYSKGGLVLHYPNKDLTLREERWAYELHALVGEVGGSLGITLGLSILTAVEILDVVFSGIGLACTHRE